MTKNRVAKYFYDFPFKVIENHVWEEVVIYYLPDGGQMLRCGRCGLIGLGIPLDNWSPPRYTVRTDDPTGIFPCIERSIEEIIK
jgi:hypothetical protein